MLADLPSSWFLAAVPALAFLWWLTAGTSRADRSGLPLPPGPPRLPIIGNALDVPTKNMEATFRAMNEQYGDVVYLDALGQPMIVLGSHEAAVDLLEKRSANYSDRSISTMAKLCGLDWVLTLINYGPWWRRHRRTFHQFFNAAAVQEYQPSQRREAHKFVLRLIEKPKDFVHHIRHLFGSTIMRLTYGIEVDEPGNESYLATVEEALAIFSAATVPGKYLVETFLVLRHVPTWFPFARFKREARAWRDVPMEVLHRPWEVALSAMKEGTAPPSMAATLVESLSRLPPDAVKDEEAVAKQTTAVVYGAGADTTLSTVQTFFLAMASNPDVQKKAQAELDAVIGPTRLPDFADQDSLPYIGVLIKELLRWRSVVPLGIPHRSLEEDEYRGYRIPKGSIVISNIWAYSRDPSVYPDPEAFMPERFLKDGKLNPDVRDSATIAFGYGRRICPGRHFAEASLFVIVTTVLHTLSISAPLGEDGRPVRLEGKMTHGILSYPEPFECVIEPRSRAAETLIRTSCLE
ncbi:CyP450 monooxygenase [Polyporus arcularius HHB13444]|uniref:CyP450 monooxygenase n=1 Tax=Polyporus arcularius HHB13444 TaxID=1314778 RepID=A0A5C3P9S7_9APHY|nr:CyP450 monooxygenase [Polyporus arcularius HHB13444]